jgi:predicted DNA-binding transcriptional regulator YafY
MITAAELAELLEVSERTIYRDVQALLTAGVPILGTPGVGYNLLPGFHLPPLMFTSEELTALLLGARMVQSWADPELAKAAGKALTKIRQALPGQLAPSAEQLNLFAPDLFVPEQAVSALRPLREAIAAERKTWLHYQDRHGVASERVVWPLGLFYWGGSWTLAAWCELRQGFREFRLDRIQEVRLLLHRFEAMPGRRLEDYLRLA